MVTLRETRYGIGLDAGDVFVVDEIQHREEITMARIVPVAPLTDYPRSDFGFGYPLEWLTVVPPCAELRRLIERATQ